MKANGSPFPPILPIRVVGCSMSVSESILLLSQEYLIRNGVEPYQRCHHLDLAQRVDARLKGEC